MEPSRCNLDSLLNQLSPQVTSKWYELGLVIGIDTEILDEYSRHPPRLCLVEVLEHWLRNNPSAPTWRNVAEALKEIELHELAASILEVYKTGNLLAVYPKMIRDIQCDNEICCFTHAGHLPIEENMGAVTSPPLPPKV